MAAEKRALGSSRPKNQRSSGPSSSLRTNGFDVDRAAVALEHAHVVLEHVVRLLERVVELVALEQVLVPPGSSELRSCGFTDRPTAQTAPGFRSIQITIRSSLPASSTPSSCAPRTGLPSSSGAFGKNTAAMLKLSSVLRNPFSFLFARSSQEERVAAYVIREHERGAVAGGDPRGPVRAQPPHAAAAARGCSTARTSSARSAQDTVAAARDSLPTRLDVVPMPRSRARSSAAAPMATSQAARPFDLKTTTSPSD